MALDVTFSILCELLIQWDLASAGLPILLEWLLGKDDLEDFETTTLVPLASSTCLPLECFHVQPKLWIELQDLLSSYTGPIFRNIGIKMEQMLMLKVTYFEQQAF